MPTNTVKVPSKKTENQSLGSPVPAAPETSAPSSTSPPESSNGNEEGTFVCFCFIY